MKVWVVLEAVVPFKDISGINDVVISSRRSEGHVRNVYYCGHIFISVIEETPLLRSVVSPVIIVKATGLRKRLGVMIEITS